MWGEEFLSRYERLCYESLTPQHSGVIAAGKAIGGAEGASGDETKFALTNVTVGPRGCQVLAEALASIPLKVVAVSHAYACDDGARALVSALAHTTTCNFLQFVDVSGNSVKDASIFSPLVVAAAQLRELILDWNKFGLMPSCFDALAQALKTHRSLKKLSISNNLLGGECAIPVAEVVKCSPSLQSIDISWNNFGQELHYVADALVKHNNSLVTMPLEGNNGPLVDVEAIAVKLRTNEKSTWQQERVNQAEKEIVDKVAGLEGLVADLKGQLEQEKKNSFSLEKQVEGYNAARSSFTLSLDEYEKARAALQRQLDQIEAKNKHTIEESEKKMEIATKEAEELRSKLQDLNQKSFEEKQALMEEISTVRRERDSAQDMLAATKRNLEAAHEETKRLQSELTEKRRETVELLAKAEDNGRLATELASKRSEVDAMDAKLREITTQSVAATAQLHIKEELLATAAKETEREIALVDQRHRREKQDWDAAMAAAEAEHKGAIARRDQAVKDLQEELEKLRSEHAEEVLILHTKASDNEKVVADSRAEVQKLLTQGQISGIELRKAQQGRKLVEERLAQAQKELAEVNAINEEKLAAVEARFEEEILALERECEERGRLSRQLETELQRAQTNILKLSSDRDTMQQKMQRRVLKSLHQAMSVPIQRDADDTGSEDGVHSERPQHSVSQRRSEESDNDDDP